MIDNEKKICILGAGGFGREVLCCLIDQIATTNHKIEEIACFMVSEEHFKETKEISNISLMSEIFKVNAKQAIRDGVKELKVWKSDRRIKHGYFELVNGYPTYTPMTEVNDVIDNGVKEVYDDIYHHKSRIDGVLKKGDKL